MLMQRYRTVLKKCHLRNVLGGLVIAGALLLGGGAGTAQAASPISISDNHQVADGVTEEYTAIDVSSGGTLGIARNGKVVGTDVTVAGGGLITSAKNLHIGTPGAGQVNTGLRADSLTLGDTSDSALGEAQALHLSLFSNGVVTINQYGKLTLDSINNDTASTWSGGKLNINGGELDIANLSIAYDKLVGTDTAGSLALNNNGQLKVRETLTITGSSFTNTLTGAIKAGSLDMGNANYTHNTGASLNLIGTAGGGAFFTGGSLSVSQGDVFLGSDATPSGTHSTSASVAVNGGTLQVGHGTWKSGALSQTAGNIKVSGNGELTVDSLNQTGGLLTVGGNDNTGKLVVDGLMANTTYASGSTGIAVTGTGVLDVKYSEFVKSDGTDLKDTTTQKAINMSEGGTLMLSGYNGAGMNLPDFATLTGKLLAVGSTGTVSGVTITGVGETTALQDVADAHAAVPDVVVDGSAGISSGAAAVGGVKGATSVTGNASLTLTGQNTGNIVADAGITLNNGSLTLGNPAGGSTGGTLNGGIDASSGNNTINVVNGAHTVNDGLTGSAGTIVTVGGSANAGTLIATDIDMNGGRIDFDPPFVAAGDTSNASLGGLSFAASSVDALLNVGQNSMVSLGSTDAEWLRTEVTRYQNDGKGLWGRDITAALAIRAPQTLDATGGINVDGAWVHGGAAATANTVIFADKSLLVVDATGVGNNVALSGQAAAPAR